MYYIVPEELFPLPVGDLKNFSYDGKLGLFCERNELALTFVLPSIVDAWFTLPYKDKDAEQMPEELILAIKLHLMDC